MSIITKILLSFAGMFWDIYWGIALGFMLSSVIRAFIPASTINTKLGKNNIKGIGLASFFGAVSSSCSYAAASMSRTLLIKGATWPNAVAFMIASTNLVFEIFIVIVSVLGWAFFGAEIIGGFLFIMIGAFLIASFYPKKVMDEAEKHLTKAEKDEMHDHSHKHIDKERSGGSISLGKLKAASGHFYMDVTMVGKDVLMGVVIASVIMAVVPDIFWKTLFLTGNSNLPGYVISFWNVLIGEVVAVVSFVCSVGNIVLAAALWKGGISFGGVIAYILADLITIPMLAVYRSYYGKRTMFMLLLFLGISIMITALLVDAGFSIIGWIPTSHALPNSLTSNTFEWNYKTILNIIFIPLSVIYFFLGKERSSMTM